MYFNAKEEGGICDHDTGNQFLWPADNLPYWLPRFYPRAVNDEIKEKTGVKF